MVVVITLNYILETYVAFGLVDRLRPLSYAVADVFVLCFSVTSLKSFDLIKHKWINEIQRHDSKIPFIIVGTKTDTRTDGVPHVSSAEGRALCVEFGGYGYMECSALTNDGLSRIFDEAIRASVTSVGVDKVKMGKCVIL